TAGFCDPGWKGTLTLELNNLTRVPIKLYAGLPIAQLSFMTLDAAALRPYGHEQLGSHYQGQVDATPSRYGPRSGVRWPRRRGRARRRLPGDLLPAPRARHRDPRLRRAPPRGRRAGPGERGRPA